MKAPEVIFLHVEALFGTSQGGLHRSTKPSAADTVRARNQYSGPKRSSSVGECLIVALIDTTLQALTDGGDTAFFSELRNTLTHALP